MNVPENVIETSGLTKTYGGGFATRVEALRGVDIKVGPGEAFGLLGPNGAGKTTLVKILLGLVHATSGAPSFSARQPAILPPACGSAICLSDGPTLSSSPRRRCCNYSVA